MKNIKSTFLPIITIVFCFFSCAYAENFFDLAKQKFIEKKFDESKFLFQRNIVFNPKNSESYLYLAKIFEKEENEVEKIKNIKTTLLLEPKNEEAMYMLISYELEKSNYSRVKELKKDFLKICKKLCEKTKKIDDSLKDIEPKT